MVWPNLKPKLREILKKLYSHALAAGFTMRNALLTNISERATGAIVTGALVGITAAAQSVNGATARECTAHAAVQRELRRGS